MYLFNSLTSIVFNNYIRTCARFTATYMVNKTVSLITNPSVLLSAYKRESYIYDKIIPY